MSCDQTPEQVIAQHLRSEHWNAQHDGWVECACGEPYTAEHQLAALRTAGFAVVKLPEVDDLAAEQRRYSLSVPGGINGLPPIREDSAGWTLRRFASSEARRQAAALLATADQADAAEAGQ